MCYDGEFGEMPADDLQSCQAFFVRCRLKAPAESFAPYKIGETPAVRL